MKIRLLISYMRRIGVAGWLFLGSVLLLLLYSYTQVDLGLTLSGNGYLHRLQNAFQYVGYFRRPLSTELYLGILAIAFGAYAALLVRIRRGIESTETVVGVVVGAAVLLIVSYPAFSYDFFNYLFTAKSVLEYGRNPYVLLPIWLNGIDPYLAFMHWTHLPSAYTPLWIIWTLPVYLLSGNFLLAAMWSLKTALSACYVAACWAIWMLTSEMKKRDRLLAVVIFAANPLVIIESLVSSHNDILMMAVALWAVYFAKRSRLLSWWMLAVSVAVKLMTVFLVPAYFRRWNRWWMLCGMLLSFILVQFQRDVLPWYWLWVMPFVALFPDVPWVWTGSVGVSLGLLLRYAPFLYQGNWNPPAPSYEFWLTAVPSAVSCVTAAGLFWRSRNRTG